MRVRVKGGDGGEGLSADSCGHGEWMVVAFVEDGGGNMGESVWTLSIGQVPAVYGWCGRKGKIAVVPKPEVLPKAGTKGSQVNFIELLHRLVASSRGGAAGFLK